jgi:hypothetical protein
LDTRLWGVFYGKSIGNLFVAMDASECNAAPYWKALMHALKKASLALGLITPLLLSGCGGDDTDGTPPGGPAYSAVVDAGSSGSRIFLYRATPSGDFGTIDTLLDYSPGSIPALSSFTADATQAGPQGIQPLLDRLGQVLTDNQLKKEQVRVSVLGTAGMRTVDGATSAAIYDSVRKSIGNAGYAAADVGTITGQNEGLYSWADVNYLSNTFQTHAVTYGIVEVGGASAQVVYISQAKGNANVVTKTVNGTSYPVFSISYPSLGQNSARASMIASTAPGGGATANACYLPGYTYGGTAGDPSPAPGVTTLTGAYDYATCQGLFQLVMGSYDVANTAVADGFGTAMFLLVGGSVSGVLGSWGLTKETDDPRSLLTLAQSQCQGSNWSTFAATYPAVPTRFLQPQCANSTYLGTFLFDTTGLALKAGQGRPVAKVGGVSPTWTLGYVLITQLAR